MKVKRMGITKILRRIWLFSANNKKNSESFSKQPNQLIIVAHKFHNKINLSGGNLRFLEKKELLIIYNFEIVLSKPLLFQKRST